MIRKNGLITALVRRGHPKRNEIPVEGDTPDFQFVVNGRPVRIWGTNSVPADVLHSRDCKQYPLILENLLELECNMVRIWGGGVYEEEEFYDFCDAHGILVWQDFMMACAIYPESKEFKDHLSREARQVVTKLRQHPSIALWSGDNECDLVPAWIGLGAVDPNTNSLTRELLPQICRECDPRRPYLPSSPFVSQESFRKSRQLGVGRMCFLPETHLWFQDQPFNCPDYTQINSSFISEIGRMGCPNESTLRKFLPENSLWPGDNDDWCFHGSCPFPGDSPHFAERYQVLFDGVKSFFGKVPDALSDFVMASQIYQAEAMKFLIEYNRLRSKCSGLLWWNLKDAAPLLSDSAVDYYGEKKLLWYYLRRLQAGVLGILTESDHQIGINFVNDTSENAAITYKVDSVENGEKLCAGELALQAGTMIKEMVLIPRPPHGLLRLVWNDEKKERDNFLLLFSDNLQARFDEAKKYWNILRK